MKLRTENRRGARQMANRGERPKGRNITLLCLIKNKKRGQNAEIESKIEELEKKNHKKNR